MAYLANLLDDFNVFSVGWWADHQEAAEQLRLAQQTANDMEVLYLDTQRKLSQLQTQQREKELSYEEELASLRSTFNGQMDSELAEKKSLTKELVNAHVTETIFTY